MDKILTEYQLTNDKCVWDKRFGWNEPYTARKLEKKNISLDVPVSPIFS